MKSSMTKSCKICWIIFHNSLIFWKKNFLSKFFLFFEILILFIPFIHWIKGKITEQVYCFFFWYFVYIEWKMNKVFPTNSLNAHVLAVATRSKQQIFDQCQWLMSFFILINWFIARCRYSCYSSVVLSNKILLFFFIRIFFPLFFIFWFEQTAPAEWQILDKFINTKLSLSVKILALWWWMFIRHFYCLWEKIDVKGVFCRVFFSGFTYYYEEELKNI